MASKSRLGDALTGLRERNDLSARQRGGRVTQQHVASAIGVEQPTISDWESGRVLPRPHRLPRIAAVYGLPLRRLRALWRESALAAMDDRGGGAL